MFRRRSLLKTRRQLHANVDEYGREAVMDWWTEAERRFTTDEDSSPLAGYLMFAMALALDADSVAKVPLAAYLIGMRAGYSLRACIDTVVLPLDVVVPESLDVSLFDTARILAVAGGPVYTESEILSVNEVDREVLQPVFEYLTAVADSRFEDVASVDVPFWNACVALATYQLQKNAQETDLVRSGRRLNEITVESVLRFGFVVRCLDEALGIETELDRSS